MIRFTPKVFSVPSMPLLENALNLFRVAVENFARDVNRCPLVSGNLVEDISFTGLTSTKVYHKLGRVPKGWIVVGAETNYVQLYETEKTSLYITFYPRYTFTLSIWFF